MLLHHTNFPQSRSRLTAFFVVSVGIHLLVLLIRAASPSLPHPEERIIPIEVAELPKHTEQNQAKIKNRPKEQEIAETEQAENNELDENAKVLSNKSQTALQQTRAARIDDFREKTGTGLKSRASADPRSHIPPTAEENKEAPREEKIAEGPGETTDSPPTNTPGVKRNWKTLSLKDLSVGGDGGAEAASDDRLDEFQRGDRTLLSTREFKYFSYYNRIKDLLRQHWKPTVERKLAKLYNKGRTIGEAEMTTRVLVLLNDAGQVQKVSRVEGSGIDEIDSAAIEAFERAAPFPNPPKALVESDGFVRLRWDFILKTESAPLIQFRSGGGPQN